MDQQVAIGITGHLDGNILIGPVGFVHPPDPRHTISSIHAAHRNGSRSAAIIITPGEERSIIGDAAYVGIVGSFNAATRGKSDKLSWVDAFALLLMKSLAIFPAQTGDIILERSIDGGIPHFCAGASQVVARSSLIQRNTIF